MPQTTLPEPFDCPVCGHDDIGISVKAFISLTTHDVLPGSTMDLAADSHWECLACDAYGPLREDGPWFHADREHGAGVDPKMLKDRSI